MKAPHLPKPCHENWKQMTPYDKGRFCSSCSKAVIDFTQPNSFSKIEDFEDVCGRFKRFERKQITYHKKWYHRPPELYRKTMVAFLTFVSFHLLGIFQVKAQDKNLHLIDASYRRGTIKVSKVKGTIQDLSISGRVMDKTENEPVAFAMISIMQNGTSVAQTFTDMDGNYKLTINRNTLPTETIDLTVSFIGYQVLSMKDIPLTRNSSVLDLSLIQMKTQLMGLCVINIGCGQFMNPSEDHSTTIIGGEDIRNSPYRH